MILPSLSVQDVNRSVRFYTEQLGFAHDFTLPGADGEPAFARVSLGSGLLGLSRVKGTFDAQAVGFMIYLPDELEIKAYYELVLSRNTLIVEPLQLRFWGDTNFIVHDPDGYVLALSQSTVNTTLEQMSDGMRRATPTP